ncbi:MAG: ferritin-like domain-containing protein [Candidatus Polarisedimenticolaceae bacterium]|nr:ferritin-like domain-containing protein [Candidatus Polarisedimenticolaceae bacterium]
MSQRSLFDIAHACLASDDVEQKLQLTEAASLAWKKGELTLFPAEIPAQIEQAGHPSKPILVAPQRLERRGLGSERGRAVMIHAITHIEFNAINLAWDAVHRFQQMPEDYYSDWIQVALDEVYHFRLLQQRLQSCGHEYGDFTGHNGLWDLACRTAHDPLVRMALIPRMMEAHGLDVTPGIIRRFEAIGDNETVDVLQVIMREEVSHVMAGNRWFQHLCQQRGLGPESTYFDLLDQFNAAKPRAPLNREARLQAGFTPIEIERLSRNQ